MPQTLGHITHLLCGSVQPFHLPETFSAIAKQPVQGPVHAGPLGLHGDQQADQRVHGGVDKAIHQYPSEHYVYWREQLGELPVLQAPGAFGENIASTGMTEADVCLGDQLQIGTALLEVSQSRQPCWKLNLRFDTADMSLRVQQTGKNGWYYRVLKAGDIHADDAICLAQRPLPDWPLTRVNALIFATTINTAELQAFSQLPLPPSWRKLIERRLESGQIEDMHKRLYGA